MKTTTSVTEPGLPGTPFDRSHPFRGEGNGTPLQYSCLENPMGGGAWWAAVHGVAKSRTRLSDFTFIFPPRDAGAWWAAVYGVTQS